MTTINSTTTTPKTTTTATTGAKDTTTSAASTVGSTKANPFVISATGNFVNWKANGSDAPQFVSYNNTTYQHNGVDASGNIRYSNPDLAVNKTLILNFTGQTKQVQTGSTSQQVQVGTKQVQVGSTQVQTGTKQVQTGTEKVKTGTTTTYSDSTVNSSLHLSREIDGQNATGAIGDMLTRGTSTLSDANTFFSGDKFNQYKVSSLTGEDNQVTSSAVDPTKQNLGSDDMYLAGDPQVGGKGNNYTAVGVTPSTGIMTVYEDGSDTGRKTIINTQAEQINTQGNKAFTQYGFVVQDDSGAKTKATLAGGQLNITAPDGTAKTLKPGETYTVGNTNDPTAKFYYASMPGGENGTNEDRLVFESYEKPSADVVSKLVAGGMSQGDATAMRQTTQATFGFRIPDGKGSYRDSDGVTGAALNVTSNNVKTYYDAHFSKPDQQDLSLSKTVKTPTTTDVYTDKPVYKDVPVYTSKPVYKDVPVYDTKTTPIYSTAKEICPKLYSPLVLDLDGKGIKTTASTKNIDIDGDGQMDQTSWFAANNGVLAFDANKNGKIDNTGLELLGDSSDVNGTGKAGNYANGFEALKALANTTLGSASTADNILDANEIQSLQNKAGLRILVNGQSKTLSSQGVTQLNLGYTTPTPTAIDQYGNQTRQTGSFQRTLSNGSTVTRSMNDVWLNKNDASSTSAADAVVSSPITSTPTVQAAAPTVKPVVATPVKAAPVSIASNTNTLSQAQWWSSFQKFFAYYQNHRRAS